MSDSEEEIYSIMFSSLKHPARRKILRMLSDRTMTFSQMLEELGISSSHLTYHLENLGELVSKTEEGQYRLSTFGEASVNTMKIVEEAPAIQSRFHLTLPFRWKAILAVLAIGLILSAAMSTAQFFSLNQLSRENEILESKYDRLLSLSTGTDDAISFLQDIVQIDISEYDATLLSNTVQYRSDLGGVIEEVSKYSLVSSESQLDVTFRFRDKKLSRYQLVFFEFVPIYAEPQPANILEMARNVLKRLGNHYNASYLSDMIRILAKINSTGNFEIIDGPIKLKTAISGGTGEIIWMYTQDGVDFSAKSLQFIFENYHLRELTDGWFLFNIGSTEVRISGEEAIQIARDYVKGFSWRVGGMEVKDFIVLDEPVTAELIPHPRENPIALIPYWYVTLNLDKVYPGEVSRIAIGLWADTGEVSNVRTMS